MKLVLSFFVWIAMAAFLARGLFNAVHGSFWMLLCGLAVFIVLVAKIGCLSHD